jgi:TPR repeat protein/tRNA A-37 threonylcarbamoyl transferase component Bud32
MDSGTPKRFGPYLVRRELGRGAMGVVYEAFDALLGRPVAVKALRIEPKDPAEAEALRLRFRREAQAARRLSHPNIVGVYAYGEAGGALRPYIAMELVSGRDLRRALEAGRRFTLREARRIMRQLLGALEHAHTHGVVHRDIKPANLMLRDDGRLKVMDFGVAKLDTGESAQWGSPIGTLSHMSPEQLAGQPVDRRSDLFSCGVLLYQLLTGEAPFGGSMASVIQKVLYQDPVPPSMVAPGVPAVLDPVVQRALAKRPAERHDSARALAVALEVAFDEAEDAEAAAAEAVQPGGLDPRNPWRRPFAVGLGLLAAVGVAQGLWRMQRTPPQAAPATPQAECAEEALRGDPRCQVALGDLYRNGTGVQRDPALALHWYRRAAAQGNAAAQYELGVMYESGVGVTRDPAQALQWIRQAAAQGLDRAQNHLGRAYERGLGVPVDVSAALQWYGKAAAQGHPPSQAQLGRLYLRGRGVRRNITRAAELLHRAAARRNPDALFHLGWMYEKGVGKPRDVRLAALLYRQALGDGDLDPDSREAAKAFLNAYPSL